jgi:hypothetical protein
MRELSAMAAGQTRYGVRNHVDLLRVLAVEASLWNLLAYPA